MRAYLCRRLLQTVLMTALLSLASFCLMSWMPGDPVDVMIAANPKMTAADRARLLATEGLDRPLLLRYLRWLGRVAHGDLGYSRTYRVPVTTLLGPRLVNTFILAGIALVLALVVAVPVGVIAALKRNTAMDYGVNLAAFAGISMPAFFLGLLLIMVFAVWLGVLPAGGTESPSRAPGCWALLVDRARHLVLPVLTLAALQAAVFVRYARGAMVEVLRQDWMRTARAKGLSPAAVLFRHGLRNALIPVVTVAALQVSMLFSGAVITETLFAYQGMGKLVFDAIMGNDYNVAMVAFLITVVMVLLMNLVADVLYAWLDPRIRLPAAG